MGAARPLEKTRDGRPVSGLPKAETGAVDTLDDAASRTCGALVTKIRLAFVGKASGAGTRRSASTAPTSPPRSLGRPSTSSRKAAGKPPPVPRPSSPAAARSPAASAPTSTARDPATPQTPFLYRLPIAPSTFAVVLDTFGGFEYVTCNGNDGILVGPFTPVPVSDPLLHAGDRPQLPRTICWFRVVPRHVQVFAGLTATEAAGGGSDSADACWNGTVHCPPTSMLRCPTSQAYPIPPVSEWRPGLRRPTAASRPQSSQGHASCVANGP